MPATFAGKARSLRGKTAATIARDGVVQSPEGRELFGAMTVSENLDMGGHRLDETCEPSAGNGCSTCSRS